METLFIGKNLLFLHEVESTNTYAMNLLRNVNAIEGTVVYTDYQTQGKGQRGSAWTSKIGENITLSVIIKPHFLSLQQSFYLSKVSALAVYDLLTDILVNSQYDIKIKWPNDILVNQSKIAGILIENNFTSNFIQHSVIGIGLNVNQVNFIGIDREVTSLKQLLNLDLDRDYVMKLLFSKIEKWYLKLRERNYELIDNFYLKNVFGMGIKMDFEDINNLRFTAKTINVSKNGKLVLELEDLSLTEFDIKEVRYLF